MEFSLKRKAESLKLGCANLKVCALENNLFHVAFSLQLTAYSFILQSLRDFTQRRTSNLELSFTHNSKLETQNYYVAYSFILEQREDSKLRDSTQLRTSNLEPLTFT
jgi:hypothetical protein